MPRPRKKRRICFETDVKYFKPAGISIRTLEEIELKKEEIEALRLKDFLGKAQEDCAKEMEISQPTFHRLLLESRKKVTDAIVNGKAIKIEE